MALTTLVFFALYCIMLVMTFKKPFYGIILFISLYHINPDYAWWARTLSDAGIRWSFYASMALLISYFIYFNKFNIKIPYFPPQHKWLILLTIMIFLSTMWTVTSFDSSWELSIRFLKFVIFYLLLTKIIYNYREYNILIWTIILGCFYFGWQGFIDPSTEGGRLVNIGGPDSRESNGLAAHIIITMPFLGLYFLKGKKWEKILVIIVSPFILNLLILTRTRSAFLGVLAMVIVFFVIMKGKYIKQTMPLLFIGAIAFVYLSDEGFWGRMETIEDYEQEGSAASRLELWKASIRIGLDHPLGVGPNGARVLMPIYSPSGYAKTSHNTFFLALAEQGLLGFFFLIALILSTIKELHKIRRYRPENEFEERIYIESIAIETAYIGFYVAGFFTGRLYAEAPYWLVGCAVILRKIHILNKIKS